MSTTETRPGRKAGLAHRLYTGDIRYDFIGHRKRWYSISGALLLISVLAIAFLGLRLGIEFKGGADFTVPTPVTATRQHWLDQSAVGGLTPNAAPFGVRGSGDRH